MLLLPTQLRATDCNGNDIEDAEDLLAGTSQDCNESGIPDICEQSVLRLGRVRLALDLVNPPNAILTADMDGDGDLDIVTSDLVNATSAALTVYFREASDTGNPTAPATYTENEKILALAGGDFDGDGDVDVATLRKETIGLRWNDGTGDLTNRGIIFRSPGSGDDELLSADMNGDGIDDLVLAHAGLDQVHPFLGRENGSFQNGDPVATGNSPRSLVAGDFDGDGDLDLATANWISVDLSVLINDSDPGGFSLNPATVVEIGGKPRDLAAADLDDDGRDDLVVGTEDATIILRNQNDGQSFETETFASGSWTLDVADMDGNGSVDIISVARQSDTVSVLPNDGMGTFTSKLDFVNDGNVGLLLKGDFDVDGDIDIALRLAPGPLALSFLGNGEGETIATRSIEIPRSGIAPHTVVFEDLDGDGDRDLATGAGDNGSLSILLNNGLGNFVPFSDQPGGGVHANSLASGDVDRDGDIDLALVGFASTEFRVFYNDGKAVFERKNFVGPNAAFFVTMADLDGDDYLDLVSANRWPGSISIALNDGTGEFIFPNREIIVQAAPRSVAAADFDRDGDVDLAVSNKVAGTVSLLFNHGNATFAEPLNMDAKGDPHFIVAGDWNRDGFSDLATVNNLGRSAITWINRQDGRFEFDQLIALGVHLPYSLTCADFNGDGFEDLITSNENSGSASVLFNDHSGKFFIFDTYSVGAGPRYVSAGDVDGDEDVDLVGMSRAGGKITVIFNESELETKKNFEERLCTVVDFDKIAVTRDGGVLTVKYTLPARDDPDLIPTVFQNTRLYALHEDFLGTVFPTQFPGLTASGLVARTQLRKTRDYFIGALERVPTAHGFQFAYSIVTAPSREEALELEEVSRVHDRMSETIALRPLKYAPDLYGQDPIARETALSWDDTSFPILFDTLSTDTGYTPYTLGVGYGRIRLLTRNEFDTANVSGLFTFQDIVITDHAPRTIEGVVGGLITAAPQGALSHLPILTARRGTPNAFVADTMAAFEDFDDVLVRLEVGETSYSVREASLEEAEEFWDMRPSLGTLPPVDQDYQGLDRFTEIDFSSAVALESRFGGKATGLARLQTILTEDYEEYREVGFAIPMHYYVEFMSTNRIPSEVDGSFLTYEEYLTELFNLPHFQTDSSLRWKLLKKFRDSARSFGQVPEGLLVKLGDRIEEIFGARNTPVRFRSSSNVEDRLQFNGAGLYESTSVCVLDSFDQNGVGPSLCDPTKQNERSIERALKKVWTSLWTFPAHEERSFFRIPQDPMARDVAMGILVNRAFLDEAANGVAFTGDPSNPRGGCFLINVQAGEESVVSPEPGILPETDILPVADGRVVEVIRSTPSTLVPRGEVVLSDAELEELGALMWHIDQNYPLDTEGFAHDDILLDLEFKLEQDGSLAVKQIRPFLVSGQRREWPSFELEVPVGAATCGVMNLNSPSASPLLEYEAKSQVTFRPGNYQLPARQCVFSADIIEQVLVGPGQELAVAEGPGVFQVREGPDVNPERTVHRFSYKQFFSLPAETGETRRFELNIFNLEFLATGTTPVARTLVLDEDFITFGLRMTGFMNDPQLTVTYGSCNHHNLPHWELQYDLAENAKIRLRERFLPVPDITVTGPASLKAAEIVIGNTRRLVNSYWNLVYSSRRHNIAVVYWIVLDQPLLVPGLEGEIHAIELAAADGPEVVIPQVPAAAYLDENFEVLMRPEVLSYSKEELREKHEAKFVRGDSNVDGLLDTTDVFRILEYLFTISEALPCRDAADANDDGRVNLSDALSTALHLFQGKLMPAPTGACGADPSEDSLTCNNFLECF